MYEIYVGLIGLPQILLNLGFFGKPSTCAILYGIALICVDHKGCFLGMFEDASGVRRAIDILLTSSHVHITVRRSLTSSEVTADCKVAERRPTIRRLLFSTQ